MSKAHPRVRFLPDPDKTREQVPLAPTDSLTSFDNPPPWEPLFEDVSSLSSLPFCRRPLDPPPSCFSTRSPIRIRSHDFPSFHIPSVSDNLTHGFRALYPCNILEGHGICRADWVRFLQDLRLAANLANEGLSRMPFGPLLAHGVFPSTSLGAVYARPPRDPMIEVRALIYTWNACAFERRKIRVTLEVRIEANGRYMLVVESL